MQLWRSQANLRRKAKTKLSIPELIVLYPGITAKQIRELTAFSERVIEEALKKELIAKAICCYKGGYAPNVPEYAPKFTPDTAVGAIVRYNLRDLDS